MYDLLLFQTNSKGMKSWKVVFSDTVLYDSLVGAWNQQEVYEFDSHTIKTDVMLWNPPKLIPDYWLALVELSTWTNRIM